MSAKAFKELFENRAFKEWYNTAEDSAESGTILQIGREAMKKFVQNSVGDFIISQEQLGNIFGKGIATDIVSSVLKHKEHFGDVEYREVQGQVQIVFKDYKYSTLNKKVLNSLQYILEIGNPNKYVDTLPLADKFRVFTEENPIDIGHVFGLSNTLVMRLKEQIPEKLRKAAQSELSSAKNIGDQGMIKKAEIVLQQTEEQIKALEQFVDSLEDVLADYDIQTSDLRGLDSEHYTKYRKTTTKWAFEWQTRTANQGSGRAIGATFGKIKGNTGLRGFFTKMLLAPSKEKISNALEGLVSQYTKLSISPGKLNILKQSASPTIPEMLADELFSILNASPKKLKDIYEGTVVLNRMPLTRVIDKRTGPSPLSKELKKLKPKIKAKKAQLKSAQNKLLVLRNKSGQFYSLASLQSLLDTMLVLKVKENMGDGSRRDILNLRSGRFAESVKVERMSQSREGMITAFYTYMKNPYATFSAGGRQEYPKTRDPKLLIAKSIREIAATKVGNRMRAVSL